ncbi:LysR family transcriptional regulator [Mycobacteroides immunogenum]|uniref:Probable hydrogen peroxide-inducible genes activator n=1 Tax=Mycobacteroides immunogenum TaxID=83262 RepID=A0A7V8LRW2_9MYCO|nr:LysR family transcriptional regulator [Mycobacteroides immunogenum]AMT73912.1 LysR family transcriptional regulator [Mycobacteroides immunogenum]ANO07096.1 LysR family transcriptional regulator [Mycobacteroides immunogenum]KIU37748.1 LysR family transcriptional regulator [Mycobacteroides immunogenum]KPG15426.1 LysR family transcriptional regulator [Mycobacteroides immunogenum]KPG16042.1 LysR family transcriptional regulator [Mycobacteroides immunogenum]
MAGSSLDIAPLRSLVAVADCGGFHRAAAVLHLTQSAVSQHVRKLETTVGEPVVRRSGRGVVFTDKGTQLLTHARRILAAHDAAVDDLVTGRERTLVLGVTEHGADLILPSITTALRSHLPDWSVRVRFDRNLYLAESVDRGTMDLAVILDGSGVDRANAVGTVGLRWVAARGYRANSIGPLQVMTFTEPCTLRAPMFSALHTLGIQYQIVGESPDLSGLYAGLRSGLGMALLPIIGWLPDGIAPVEAMPAANLATLSVVGRRGLDPVAFNAVKDAAREALSGESAAIA